MLHITYLLCRTAGSLSEMLVCYGLVRSRPKVLRPCFGGCKTLGWASHILVAVGWHACHPRNSGNYWPFTVLARNVNHRLEA